MHVESAVDPDYFLLIDFSFLSGYRYKFEIYLTVPVSVPVPNKEFQNFKAFKPRCTGTILFWIPAPVSGVYSSFLEQKKKLIHPNADSPHRLLKYSLQDFPAILELKSFVQNCPVGVMCRQKCNLRKTKYNLLPILFFAKVAVLYHASKCVFV